MKAVGLLTLVMLLISPAILAGPEEDRQAFVKHFEKLFPKIPFEEYINGIYAIDMGAREQWLEIEEFPPYEFSVEQGQDLWEASFEDKGKYSDCFPDSETGVRQNYPRFDAESGEVVTLELEINGCRKQHAEPEYSYGSDEILSLTAYLAYQSRDNIISITIPEDSPEALAAYEKGKQFYYTKRGQLNFSCSDCHVVSAGQYVRADHLSASLGHPTHFPVYRSKLGSMLSLQQRVSGCIRDVRAKPFELQSEEYRNLEYFLTYMSNGLPANGPGARK